VLEGIPNIVNTKPVEEATPEKNEKLAPEKKEMKEATERFNDLIETVSLRYKDMPDKMKENFVAHNKDILESAIKLGVKKNLPPDKMKALELAAILHDLTKNDLVPEKTDEKFKDFYGEDSAEYKRIATDYRLLMHGETAAEESKNILTDEFLIEHGIEKDAEKIRGIVSNAIAEHMGPNPGYMGFILEITNNKLREMEESEIEHPKARGTVSEILLAADMKSLASRCGIEKVISIRCNFNKTQDQKTVTDYNEKGIDLTIGEAALISALSSAFQARNMIEDSKLQTLINEVINEAIKGDYEYGLEGEKEIVNCKDTIEKQKKYLSIIAQEKETE